MQPLDIKGPSETTNNEGPPSSNSVQPDGASSDSQSPGDPHDPHPASFEDALKITGHGPYNYFQLWTCTMIILAATTDMFGISVTVAAGACDLNLNVANAGLLTSAPFAGVLLAFPWGYYADTRGRRKALLVSTSVGFMFAVLATLAPSWQVMLAFKLIGCLFSTAAFTIAMTYLGECTNMKHRSRYLFIVNTADLAAEAMYYSLGVILLPATFSYSIPGLNMTFRSWRLFGLLLAIPLGLGAVMVLCLQESPKFLAYSGQSDEAMKVLRVMFRWNVGKDKEFPIKSLSNVEKQTIKVSFWRSLIDQSVPLFKPPLLSTTLKLFYLIAACSSINNVFLMWYPTMVNQFFNSMSEGNKDSRHFCEMLTISNSGQTAGQINTCTISPNTLYAGISLGIIFAVLNLIAAALAKYRREVLAISLLVPAVCLVIINQVTEPVTNLIAFTLVQSTGIGFSCIASYYVDLYPTTYRGMAWSLGVMVGRMASMSGVNIVAASIVHHCTATFYCWTVYACSGLILTFLLPSETKILIIKD